MTIAYRDATVGDLPSIAALFRDSFVATFGHLYAADDLATFLAQGTPEAWAEEFAEPGLAFRLADDAEGLVGFIKIGSLKLPAATTAPAIEVRQLYLTDRAKGRGIAQALMDWAIDRARATGAEELWLSVFVDNHRARRFYERNGFEDRGRYDFKVGNHIDEDRLMRKKL